MRRGIVGAVLIASCVTIPASAGAQVSVIPRTFRVDAFTCREFLSLPGERRDNVLIYYNGYLDGTRRAPVWDERVAGERIERVVAACASRPEVPLLRVFNDAWSR